MPLTFGKVVLCSRMREPQLSCLSGDLFLSEDRRKPTDEEMDVLSQGGIYCWFRKDVCLYIGCTKSFWRRLVTGKHHIINEVEPVMAEDRFTFFIGEDKTLEALFIAKWKPEFNTANKDEKPEHSREMREVTARLRVFRKQHN